MMMNNLEEETQKKENVERGEGKCGMWRWRKDLGWEGKGNFIICFVEIRVGGICQRESGRLR